MDDNLPADLSAITLAKAGGQVLDRHRGRNKKNGRGGNAPRPFLHLLKRAYFAGGIVGEAAVPLAATGSTLFT